MRTACCVRLYLERTDALSGVTLLGHVASGPKQVVFAEADVYLFPTHGEGMPNSVLEAMASGLPVVTRRVGGLKDFFEDGTMGFSSEGSDPTMFAKLLEALMLDRGLARRMGDYNSRYARTRFAAPEVARRVQAICRTVLSGQSA
jgi:glycosyltransferase involved in cell wall biosynthesis